MDRKVIFHIEDRGYKWIGHWFIYMLSGFRHINKKLTFGYDGHKANGGRIIQQNIHLYNKNLVDPPFYIYFSYINDFLSYQKETFSLLKDDFKLITKEEISSNDIIINNYGETILDSEFHISKDGYIYLRNFINKIDITEQDIIKYSNKKFYLTRNKSHILVGNDGVKRRQIINDNELIPELKKYNIETINLEDYTLIEKIKIFKLSNMIISSNSGGLIFTLYSDNSKIIELNVQKPHQISRQYEDQCRCFNIPYYSYICDKVDENDNMKINVDSFIKFIRHI